MNLDGLTKLPGDASFRDFYRKKTKNNSIFIKGEFQPDIDNIFLKKCNSLKVKYYSSNLNRSPCWSI